MSQPHKFPGFDGIRLAAAVNGSVTHARQPGLIVTAENFC